MPTPVRIRALLPLCCLLLVGAAVAQKKTFSLEQSAGRGERVDLSGSTPAWSWDGQGRGLLRGRGKEAKLVDPLTLAESELPAAEAQAEPAVEAADPLVPALQAIPGMSEEAARRIASGSKQRSADRRRTLLESRDELYFVDEEGRARRLHSSDDGALELVDLAPDGSMVAYVQGNDLHVIDTALGWRRALTSGGGEERFNGKLDWVYQEEVYGRGDFKGFWWSPDSKRIAFLSLDEAPVHEFTVVDFIEGGHFRVRPEVTNYPKVGDPNPIADLGLVDVRTGSISWVDLEGLRAQEPLIVRVDWTPDGSRLLYMVQDRIQTWLDLVSVDPEDASARPLIHESSAAWVERPEAPRWLHDQSFLWESHRDGNRHVYHYRLDGKLIGAVTGGDWAVTGVLEVDEAGQRIWFTANKDGAIDTNVYRVGLDGKGLVRLTQGRGSHSVSFSPDKAYFLDRVSSLTSPTEVRLCSGEGQVLQVLGKAEIPAREEYLVSDWELSEVRARDGFLLDAAVLKPVPFDAARKYPVWISTYSGPDAPSVRNRWNASTWYQYLAQQGVIVLQVNVRSASGKGQRAVESCYKQLGVQELADIEDTVDWLCSNAWADGARVGITGYSYGGFMTAYALTHSDRFALGLAGGGVFDWRMYDTIYTERYMSTPDRNPEGYEKTSVIRAAAQLHGRLEIQHGTMDDNVHMQNAMQLVYALQKAGKPFGLMLYPQSRHGIGDRDQAWFSRQEEWRAIREYLLEGRNDGDWIVPQPASEARAGTPRG